MKKSPAKNKKGFTLVELIVVLVILAILAAILVPALSGYIDKANDRVILSEARAALMALQTIATEAYAAGVDFDTGIYTVAAAKTLSEVNGIISDVDVSGGKVQSFTYQAAAGGKSVDYVSPSAGFGKPY